MKSLFYVSNSAIICTLLTGCFGENPSGEYPNEILFQHIDVKIEEGGINVLSELSSNGGIYLSSDSEKQYLTINGGTQYPLNFQTTSNDYQENITIIDYQQLQQVIQAKDEITVTYARANGHNLISKVQVPEASSDSIDSQSLRRYPPSRPYFSSCWFMFEVS
jgi:hypothetical protein